tara:strand:+ start:1221 stop:2645 length:1425 start_codon:yes stop_codon:yes gene_type:complete
MDDNKKEVVQQEINKAINFLGQNKFSEAEIICKDIVSKKDNPDAYHILSSIKIYKQEFDESIRLVQKSIEINSDNPGYHVTLGCAYSARKDYEKSIKPFKDALKLNNKVAQVHFYLGESYRKLKKYNEAIASFYKTIELSPDHVASHMILGIVYQEKKQFDLSVKSFQTCINIMPDYAEAHINLGLCYLLVGDYDNGWREYEWRRKLFETESEKLSKEWTGQNLEDKTLLILDENSDPNLIHFIRFARELKKDNCKLILQCNDQSYELFNKQAWIDNVVSPDVFPEHDYYIYIGSLMNVLKINPNNTQQYFPYIDVDGKNRNLIKSNKFNIGLVLEANRGDSSHDDETIDIKDIENLFTDQHNVISLDKYTENNSLPIIYNSKYNYSNLDELSQIIPELDLVVTVDHVVAHLAGALNIQTFLMVPCVPNWRWEITHRHTTPWYDSVRIFRQDIPDNWTSVIGKIKQKLNEKYND